MMAKHRAGDAEAVDNDARTVNDDSKVVDNDAHAVSNDAPAVNNDAQAVSDDAPATNNDVQAVNNDGSPSAARCVDLYKQYGEGDTAVVALDHVNVEFVRNEFTAIMGPSGSGKSTLMHTMAGLDSYTSGSAFIGDTALDGLSDSHLTDLRRDRLGFIFQSFNLVPTLTAAENITLPADIAGRKVDSDWFVEVTSRLGLSNRLSHRPSELSGGQQQRVACARALVSRPEIIFGDEPTGNLDSNSSREVLSILRNAVDNDGQTVVIVTHDAKAASYADRVIFLRDGQIIDQMRDPTIESILTVMSGIEG